MSDLRIIGGDALGELQLSRTLRQVADAAANEAIIEMWGEEIEMVEGWLQETHPELIDDSGQTCWGILVGRLYDSKAHGTCDPAKEEA